MKSLKAPNTETRTWPLRSRSTVPLSPFDNLPSEILIDILLDVREHVRYQDTFGVDRRTPPVAASLVCHHWFNIIVSRPEFWHHILVTQHVILDTLRLQVARSGTTPVTVWVASSGVANRKAFHVLTPHSNRWVRLFLRSKLMASEDVAENIVMQMDEDLTEWLAGDLNLLEYLHVRGASRDPLDEEAKILSLPALRKLSFTSTVPRFHISTSPLLAVLHFKACFLSLTKLLRYLSDAAKSLQLVLLQDTHLVENDLGGDPQLSINTPSLQELHIQVHGYDGLAQSILTRLKCESLRSLTYNAPEDRHSTWRHVIFDFPLLETLDLGGHAMPAQVLRDLLFGAPALRRIVMPRLLRRAGDGTVALDLLLEYGEGGSRPLRELKVKEYSPVRLRRLLAVMPSIKQLDFTGGLITLMDRYQDLTQANGMQWLTDHDVEVIGLL